MIAILIASLVLFVVFLVLLDSAKRVSWVSNAAQKTVLITGCDTGFGNLLARSLDDLGCRVIAACLTENGAKDLKATTSDRLQTISMDVGDSKSVSRALTRVQAILSSDNGLWAVVNNAGVGGGSGPSEFHTREEYLKCLEVNLLGVIDVTNTFMPLVKASRGRVINLSSISGRVALSAITMYSVSKWGVEAYSDCIRRTLAPFGVCVSVIEPGAYGTPMTSQEATGQWWWKVWDALPSHVQQDYGQGYIKHCIVNATRYAGTVNPRVEEVVDTIKHALFAVRPRKRYAVGRMARYATIPLSYAPSWAQDAIQAWYSPVPEAAKRILSRT